MKNVADNHYIARMTKFVALAISFAVATFVSYAAGKHAAVLEANEREYSEEFANAELKLDILALLHRGEVDRARDALLASTSAHLQNLEQRLAIQKEVTIFKVMQAEILDRASAQYVIDPPTMSGLDQLRRRLKRAESH